MTVQQVPAFYADLSNIIEIAKFPEDFADWLMDEGREQDARRFLLTCKNWQAVTPAEEQTIEDVIEIAQEYAPVVNFSEEIRVPHDTSFHEAVELLRDLERVDEPFSDDEPLSWDREAALVNQMLSDDRPTEPEIVFEEPPLPEPMFPDAEVYIDDDDTITVVAGKTVQALLDEGYDIGARRFLLELRDVIRRGPSTSEMFILIWSYATVMPEIGSQISRRMMSN